MSLESWKLLFETVGLLAVGITFLFGALALIVGNRINKEQAAQLRKFDSDLTDAKNELGKQQQRAAEADAKVAGLQTAASDAKTAQQKVEIELAKQEGIAEQLKAQNLATEGKLENERKIRVELENSLAPRVLGLDSKDNEKLKPFAGVQVIFNVLADAEARRASQELQNVLRFADWNITSVFSDSELYAGFFDGVTVQTANPLPFAYPMPQNMEKQEAWEKSRKAADALVAYLLSRNWKAATRASEPDTIAPNTIKITIGFKPSPFFDPDWVKKMEDQYKQLMKRVIEEEQNPRFLPSKSN